MIEIPKHPMSEDDIVSFSLKEGVQMRKLAEAGRIIAICEKGSFEILRSGFLHACHTILEKVNEESFMLRKHRDYGDGMILTIDEVDNSGLLEYHTCIFVINREKIINVRVSDMKFPTPVSNWYQENRGWLIGSKFGL